MDQAIAYSYADQAGYSAARDLSDAILLRAQGCDHAKLLELHVLLLDGRGQI